MNSRRKTTFLVLICILCIWIAGCRAAVSTPTNGPSEVPTSRVEVEPAAETATKTPQPSPGASPFPTSTNTAEPTTTPTPTGTATQIPPLSASLITEFTVVRSGPDRVFPTLGVFAGGLEFEILGRNETGDWVLIDMGLGQSGWVETRSIAVEIDRFNIDILASPPTPTPTPTTIFYPTAEFYLDDANHIHITHFYGFKPNELILCTLIRSDTVVPAKCGQQRADANGEGNTWTISNLNKNVKATVTLVLTGDLGSTVQYTFTLP